MSNAKACLCCRDYVANESGYCSRCERRGINFGTTTIGTCRKHGRNLASREECGPNHIRVGGWPTFEDWCRAEVARLRAGGELRVACGTCRGHGEFRWAYGEQDGEIHACQFCDGTGWKWNEKR